MAKMNNRLWFQLHGWFSLPVWVLFSFVCLTGTISVLSHEITWLVNSDARANNPQNLAAKPVDELIKSVTQTYPTADVSGVMIYESYLVNAVMFTDKDLPFAVAYVNQYTGEIQEVNNGLTFIGFMRSLHGWLLFPWDHNYSVGYYIVNAMTFVMLGALVTGLVVYKKFWRAFFSIKVRFNQGTRTLLTDLHRLSGTWSIWFLIVMSLTGFWYLVQAIMWHNDMELEPYPEAMQINEVPLSQTGQPEAPVTLADALKKAEQTFDNFTPSYIAMPEHNRDSYKVSGHGGDFIFFDDFSYNIAINPWNGETEQQFSPSTMTGIQTLVHIADPLHYGTIGGIWTKIIWFVFGLILTGMSISGFFMWRLRLVKAQQKVQQGAYGQLQETV